MILAIATTFEERRYQVEQRRVAKKGCKTRRTGEENDIFFVFVDIELLSV